MPHAYFSCSFVIVNFAFPKLLAISGTKNAKDTHIVENNQTKVLNVLNGLHTLNKIIIPTYVIAITQIEFTSA